MYPVGAAIILCLVNIIWLGVLSYLFYKDKQAGKGLFPEGSEKDIREKFKEVLIEVGEVKKGEAYLQKKLKDFEKQGLDFVQRIEVLRYNPYGDTGGDQSFSVILLDGNKSGVIISSLHSRAGTRVYTKTINLGKSDLQLSKEEEKLLGKAIS